MYDYLAYLNMIKYGQLTPPEYNLYAISAPVYLHYSGNDWLSAIKVTL
jgi:lysosomal acid lipase/cholesteryl ester hydrolase